VNLLTISCDSCDHLWMVASPYSVYEQQAVESCPCPACGAYTLCCPDPDEAVAEAAPRSRRLTSLRR
jgi:hypothetical protein